MPSYRGRSSFIILAAGLAIACSNNDRNIAAVSPNEYASRNCWFNQGDSFEAFLVVAREESLAVPYFISMRCSVDGRYTSMAEAMLHHINEIRVVDSNGSLQRAFPNVTISDNIRSDLPLPSPNNRLYYFRANMVRVRDPDLSVVYSPQNIAELTDTGIAYERFLNLSMEQRERLLDEHDRRGTR